MVRTVAIAGPLTDFLPGLCSHGDAEEGAVAVPALVAPRLALDAPHVAHLHAKRIVADVHALCVSARWCVKEREGERERGEGREGESVCVVCVEWQREPRQGRAKLTPRAVRPSGPRVDR